MKRNPLSRLLSVLLCLCLVAGMLPAALAEDSVTVNVEPSVTLKPGENKVLPLSLSDSNLKADNWSVSGDANGITATTDGNSLNINVSADANDEATATFTITAQYTIPSTGDSDSTDPEAEPTQQESAPTTGTATGTCKVTVDAPEPEKPQIENVTLEPSNIQLDLNGKKTGSITAIIEPEEAKDYTISWSIGSNIISFSDSNTQSATRNIQANSTGTTTVSVEVKSTNGDSKSASCQVEVVDTTPIKVDSIKLNKSALSLAIGETETLFADVLPVGAPQTVTWKSDTPSVASVDNGKVTAKAAGTAVITAQAGDKTATCTVTVNPSGSPTISNTTLTLNVGKSSTLSVNNLPTGATVSWSIPNSSIAKLSATTGTSITVTGVTVGGPVRVTATVKNGSTTIATLSCDVTVKQASPSTITYTVAADDTVTLKASDFNSVCNGVYGTTLDYVIFDRSTSNGTLYYDYTTKDGGTKISTSTKYYSSNSASRSISSITFVPDGKSGDKATFPYTAYDTKGQRYAGTLEITIKSPSGNVKYETAKDEPVDFDSGDFDDVCRSITGSRLDYVTFTLPSSSRGTLYYDYGGKDEEKLSSSDKCYADEDDGDFGLDDITFVPKSGYTGTVTFNYSGRSTSRDSFSGTVTITISKTGSTLRYQIDEGEELDLDDSDFNDYCKDQTGANLDYVTFDLPGSSRGTLYYKYGSRDEDDISSSDKFYRSSSPRLDDVTFVPKSGYTGTVSIDFTGRSVDNDRFSGTVKIEVGDTGSGDISYTAPAGSAVSFVLSDFNDLCEDETGERLDYVTFDLPSSSRGTLYYQYGKSGEEKLSSSDKYYRSGSPRLEDVSFVPASSFSGTLEIKFSGRSTDNDRFSGTVAITYTSVKDPAIVRYTSDGGAVNFQSNDFVSACSIRGAGNLVSVKFNTPSSGTLYYGYTSPTSYGGVVNPLISFSTGTGNASISGVTYVPKAGYSGTVTLTYTGTDSKGATFTGNIAITVTPTTGSRFTDMGNYSWAAASVDFLYENGITTGTTDTTYGPAGNITRGDFVLMLARAFNLTGGDPSNSFSDVPANSYYAQAIASAKALGIAQGGGSTFNPTGALTRQDAMVLLHRTLSRTGKTIPDASASYLSRFSDGGSVASYAQSSVAALVQAGVIQGDTSGKLNPQGSLTRAEMAVILHRVLTL